MDQKLTGSNILSYRGVNAYSPPEFVLHPRPPTTSDWRNFTIGTIWLDTNNSPPDNEDIYMLVSVAMSGTPPIHIATWVTFGGGGTGPQTITGDAGGPVSPDGALNINLFSSALALEFNGFPGVNTISLDTVSGNNLLETLSDDSDVIVTADAAANIKLEGTPGHITVTSDPGANKLVFDYVGTNTDSFTTDAGVAVPVLGNLNVIGDGVAISTAGAGDTVTISSSSANKYTTDDTNHATPAAGNINIFGATGIATSSAGSTVTVAARGANFCSFSAYITADIPNVTGDSELIRYPVPFDATRFNIGGNFDTTTGLFTAPINGIYLFQTSHTFNNLGVIGTTYNGNATMHINGGVIQQIQNNCSFQSDGTKEAQLSETWIYQLNAGDTVEYNVDCIKVGGGPKTVGLFAGPIVVQDYRTTFSGALLA